MNNVSENKRVYVIGHKNPDTDSICSAIGYAYLKNQLGGGHYIPARTADINQETAYVLERFEMELPKLFTDASAQVQDIEIRDVKGASRNMTMKEALVRMRDEQISTLPVISRKNHLKGLISMNQIAAFNMEMNCDTLSQARTPIKNIIKTLNGELIIGDPEKIIERGKIIMGSSSPEFIEEQVTSGDIVICGNRYDAQLCAIEMNAACIIICSGAEVARTIKRIAEEHGTVIISTPLDTFEAACTINQSIEVNYFMFRNNIVSFNEDDSVEEARDVMGRVRHVYFPVIGSDGQYRGMISRRNFLNMRKKQLILVDHNERSQCVDGYREAEILEIVDHHRIGSIETAAPVFFRNQAVGSTATIISMMFDENGVAIPADIAGILCSAIISDTLMFRSPTCTPVDVAAANRLSGIAGVEVEELAREMFEAGENLTGRTPEEIFFTDFKRFEFGDLDFGVGQGSFVSDKNLLQAEEVVKDYIEEARRNEKLDMMFFVLTNIVNQSSTVICSGQGSEDLIAKAFRTEKTGNGFVLPGVISRKKQFIPQVLAELEARE